MEKKTFAFKLANQSQHATSKWKARDGVSLAGCSEVAWGNWRASRYRGDDGIYC